MKIITHSLFLMFQNSKVSRELRLNAQFLIQNLVFLDDFGHLLAFIALETLKIDSVTLISFSDASKNNLSLMFIRVQYNKLSLL